MKDWLLAGFLWTLVGIQRVCTLLSVASSWTLTVFVLWMLVAGAVDLVSDANVEYTIPFWGSLISGVVCGLSTALVYGIKYYGESLKLQLAMREEEEKTEEA